MAQKRGQQRKREYLQEFNTLRPEDKARQMGLALLLLNRLLGRQQPPASQQKRRPRARHL
jgi:hypothetical protein